MARPPPRSSAALAATSAARQFCGGDGDVAPRDRGRPPLAGSIRWCCTTPPRTPACAARCCWWRGRPRADGDRPRRRAGRRRRAPTSRCRRRQTPSRPEQRERVVDGPSFDDAVQVEHDRLGAEQHRARAARAPGATERRGLDGGAVGRERAEVAVVAGGENRATDGRRHQAAGGARCVECRGRASTRTPRRRSVTPRGAPLTRVSSEFARKRLKRRSRASNSARHRSSGVAVGELRPRSPSSGRRS